MYSRTLKCLLNASVILRTDVSIKSVDLELEVMRQNGELIPKVMRPRDWLPVLDMKNERARKRYYTFLFKKEMKRIHRKEDQQARQIGLEEVMAERALQSSTDDDTGPLVYGFGYNFLLRRVNEAAMNHLYNWNSLRATMFGNKLVFDCSYEKYMSAPELSSCIKQISQSFCINRMHNYPLDIALCNLNPDGQMAEKLLHCIPTLYTNDFPWTVTSKSYLDIFDHSQLCYLTSNAPNAVEVYDPETVYIIGAYVDKGENMPVSMSIAKEQKLRMAKLPLDTYVRFGGGSRKNLTLNQVLGIMLYGQTGNWREGMAEFIPKRKLYENRIKYLEAKILRDTLRRQNVTGDELDEKVSKLMESSPFRTKLVCSDETSQEMEKFGVAAVLKSQQRERRKVLKEYVDDCNKESHLENQPIFSYQSRPKSEHDFSNAARVKLREQWKK
ncbi:hypothetical protein QAD02_000299 [Eretmocerus hayati]|uniref:Uncharacterized protein n=1 Tax=Eretmocerus hayati TaxID=131215 RepID=A0ACC2ND16_9HYME|nr:hypothetical protein QAD02_000299 [Eretmocerus hayati]